MRRRVLGLILAATLLAVTLLTPSILQWMERRVDAVAAALDRMRERRAQRRQKRRSEQK